MKAIVMTQEEKMRRVYEFKTDRVIDNLYRQLTNLQSLKTPSAKITEHENKTTCELIYISTPEIDQQEEKLKSWLDEYISSHYSDLFETSK